MAVEFPTLPYKLDALAPHVSARTLEFHHGKHHRAYVDKLNAAIAHTPYDEQPLERIVRDSLEASDSDVFNNAAQAWNHGFLWSSMSPHGGGDPSGDLIAAIDENFGDTERFRTQFKHAALAHFGSGWTWLVANGGKLEILSTSNANTPLTDDVTPILTLDVWEHAYYLDYQSARDRYVETYLKHLVNWDFAAQNLRALDASD